MTSIAVRTPFRSRGSQPRRWRRSSALGALLVATIGFVAGLPSSQTAHAAPPVFADPPTRVYTAPGLNLAFTGPDAITTQTKDIVFTAEGDDSTCVVENPGDEGHSGACVFAQIEIVQPGRGAMTIDDSAIAYTTGGRSGDNTFNIGGPLADVQAAIASLVTYRRTMSSRPPMWRR